MCFGHSRAKQIFDCYHIIVAGYDMILILNAVTLFFLTESFQEQTTKARRLGPS